MVKKPWNINEVKRILHIFYNIKSLDIEEIIPLKSGASSECFHVITNNGEYILKDIEMDFMNHPDIEPLVNNELSLIGIPVSKFYVTCDGFYVGKYNGHTFHLQSFIEGDILKVNTAPKWFMKESAKILGEIHNGLMDLHSLDKGISKGFFMVVNPKSALESYKKSLKIAKERNEVVAIEDLSYRIKLLDKLKNVDLDMDKFTYKNTHGDYFISQIICKDNKINGVIDFTSARIHPACYELIRSYSYADPKCINGEIDIKNLKEYVNEYLEVSDLSDYDIKMMPYLYFYQLGVSDYYKNYFNSNNNNKDALFHYAHWSTELCRWFENNIESIFLG